MTQLIIPTLLKRKEKNKKIVLHRKVEGSGVRGRNASLRKEEDIKPRRDQKGLRKGEDKLSSKASNKVKDG